MFHRWLSISRRAIRYFTTVEKASQYQAQIYEDSHHSIRHEDIKFSAWSVIWRLKTRGFEAFFVGGTVRDLCLNRRPKDIDIITSAELHEVKSLFHRSVIVGKRFPICLIMLPSEQIEVSSFSTTLGQNTVPPDLDKRIHRNQKFASKKSEDGLGKLPVTWSIVRSLNAQGRDFSVNGLMYEPCTQLLFDYVDGYSDLKNKRLRCLKEPSASFQEDPARIFRAIRFAARLNFTIDDVTGQAMNKHANLLLTLPPPRARLEVHNIFAYGSIALAFRLMWKYGVLDCVFPRHAKYLEATNCPRDGNENVDNYLFSMLESCDKMRTVQEPTAMHQAITAIGAPLIAHNVKKLRNKLHTQQIDADVKDDDDAFTKKIAQLCKLKEDVAYKGLVQSTLERMAECKSKFYIFPRGALRRAMDNFQHVKTKHIHEAHGEVYDLHLNQSDMKSVELLEQERLEWKDKSNLGLKMTDPSEPFVEPCGISTTDGFYKDMYI